MTWTPEPWTTDMNYADYPHEVVGCYVLGHADYNRAMLCVNALAGIPDPAAFVKRAKAIEEAASNAVPMPVDGCSPAVIESMLRQAKTLVYTALAKIGGGA